MGYDVEATDGSIGKIGAATNDASSCYVVVDTGFWIFGKKRLIPAGEPMQQLSRPSPMTGSVVALPALPGHAA